MLGPWRASAPFLELLGSGGFEDQLAQLQLYPTRKPEWGQDLLPKLHARSMADRAQPQGPIRLLVHFCAQTLLLDGGTWEPLWRQIVHLTLDFGEGEYEAGLERHIQGGKLGAMNKAPPHTQTHTHTHAHTCTRTHTHMNTHAHTCTHTHTHAHTLGSEAAVGRRLNVRYCTSDAILPGETQQ